MKEYSRHRLMVAVRRLEKLYSIEDQGQTDRVIALPRSYVLNIDLLTLTHDLDF